VWDPETFYVKNVATGMYLNVYQRRLMMGHYDQGTVNWDIVAKDYPWWPQWFEFCPFDHVFETELDGMPVYAAAQPTIKIRNDFKIMDFTEKDTQDMYDKGILKIQYEFRNW